MRAPIDVSTSSWILANLWSEEQRAVSLDQQFLQSNESIPGILYKAAMPLS
jgi:hypothetical protein